MTASRETLEQLHKLLGEKLISELEGEFISPALFNSCINFLEKNGVKAPMDTNDTLKKLKQNLDEAKKRAHSVNGNVISLAGNPVSLEDLEDLKSRQA